MLLLFLSIVLLLAINYGWGKFFCSVWCREETSFAKISFVGIISICLIEVLCVFLVPLNSTLEIIITIIGICFALILKKNVNTQWMRCSRWSVKVFVLILFAAGFSPYFYDHYGYYLPTISYLSQVGFVKGIVNLDLVYGQASFWHVYQAGFSHFVDPYCRINAYLIILFLIYIAESKRWTLAIFIPLFALFIQQPTTDLPVWIIGLIIINELLDNRSSTLILNLALLAFCIKPLAFWLPLLVVIHAVWQRTWRWEMLIPITGFGILYTSKNLLLTGFPLFPLSLFSSGEAWSVHPKIMTYSKQIGELKSFDMQLPYKQVEQMTMGNKLMYWFLESEYALFYGLILISLLILILLARKHRFYLVVMFCLLIKLLLVFLTSVQPRFLLDISLIVIFLVLMPLRENISKWISCLGLMIVALCLGFGAELKAYLPSNNSTRLLSSFHIHQLWKPAEAFSDSVQKIKIGNLEFYTSNQLESKKTFPYISLATLKVYQYYKLFPQKSESGFEMKELDVETPKHLEKTIIQLTKQ